ncbi:unnamed protein product [Aureobasidium mustum]|uniref:Alpha-type protein kinase domain-containing protein n=1 Tax=Aureobasidium mustum TaxID=2773714 RepID=A0A9N8PL31_9PEZI|nr:unnamed protein product [Aureobasidium mustum]
MKLQLQSEVDQANAKQPPRDTKGLFKKACSTDLLFLIDTTYSMKPYLDSAKEQVRSIVLDIKRIYFNESEVRIAVVSYKDHQSTTNVEFLDFTTSTERVFRFLDGLYADSGHDLPEDVLGGIDQALRASWNQQTRCMIHIADAPPHSHGLHDLSSEDDDYYMPGSEPHGLTYKPLLSKLIHLKITYVLLRIELYTDRMALAFAQVYGQRNAKLHTSNTYYSRLKSEGSDRSSMSNDRVSAMEPQFEEHQLGIEYGNIQHLVVRSVTNSVSRTAGRLSMTWSTATKIGEVGFSQSLEDIQEEKSVGSRSSHTDLKGSIEKVSPQWTNPGWFEKTFEMQGFCPAAVIHDSKTLSCMMAADENIKLDVVDLTVQARSKPFAQGSVRNAFYARTATSHSRFVLKSFIRGTNDNRPKVIEDMRIQAMCKAFALEFNGLLDIEPPLDFIVTSCLQTRSKTSPGPKGGCMSLERFVGSEYIKYNNNGGWVNEDLSGDTFNQMAQAFSHFTFERSWGLFLVNDLQGVNHLLTDPAIQTSDEERFKLHETNLGESGFKFFFAGHECNTFCRELGLKSNREMFETGSFDFRKEWPSMAPTVCCSNKFCRSIIRVANSSESVDFPGHQWCGICWKQLNNPTVQYSCIEDGPKHEFEVSEFFYESQGQFPPRKCPDHREKDVTEASAGSAGEKMWNRMKSAGSKGSLLGNKW